MAAELCGLPSVGVTARIGFGSADHSKRSSFRGDATGDSEQGLAGGVRGPGGDALDPARRRQGTAEGHEHVGHADGVLPGQFPGDPAGDQGVAEPSAEGFGGEPRRTWLICCHRGSHAGSARSMARSRRRSRSLSL